MHKMLADQVNPTHIFLCNTPFYDLKILILVNTYKLVPLYLSLSVSLCPPLYSPSQKTTVAAANKIQLKIKIKKYFLSFCSLNPKSVIRINKSEKKVNNKNNFLRKVIYFEECFEKSIFLKKDFSQRKKIQKKFQVFSRKNLLVSKQILPLFYMSMLYGENCKY